MVGNYYNLHSIKSSFQVIFFYFFIGSHIYDFKYYLMVYQALIF